MDALYPFALALGLGLLVGLQREYADKALAGVRTFALITVLGSVCAYLSADFGGWMVGVGLASVAAFFIMGDMAKKKSVSGLTTEFAGLLMFGVGALTQQEDKWIAVAIGGAVALVLYLKDPLHELIESFESRDLRGVMQLVLVGLVILPLMPDQNMGPNAVVNPRQAWMIVALIVGISLAGYVAQRIVGPRAGSVLAGLLGGVVSSTATTVAESRRATDAPDMAGVSTVVIVVASTVAFVRLLVEVAVASPSIFWDVLPPLGTMAGGMVLIGVLTAVIGQRGAPADPDPGSPTDLRGAVVFGLLYVGVLVLVEVLRNQFGENALYVLSAISGLTDVDAITLSTAHLAAKDKISARTAWELILIAGIANMVFKYGVVVVLGNRKLMLRALLPFGASVAGGVAILLLWP